MQAPRESAAGLAGIRGSTASLRGTVLGDLITSIDGSPVRKVEDLLTAIEEVPIGGSVELGIERDGKPGTVKVALRERGT